MIPKAALGRGLGSLMKKPGAPINVPEPGTQPLLSPGMATLLRRNGTEPAPPETNGEEQPAPAPEPQAEKSLNPLDPDELAARRLYQCSLFVADVLLLWLAVWIVFAGRGPFGISDAILCVAAVGTGAWLSCLALWME